VFTEFPTVKTKIFKIVFTTESTLLIVKLNISGLFYHTCSTRLIQVALSRPLEPRPPSHPQNQH
jgi:hypothetical protein